MMDNIILHIPHASLCLPPDFWRDITVGKEIVERELCFIADYKVDELVKNIDSHKIIDFKNIEVRNESYKFNNREIFSNLSASFEKGKKYLIQGDS